MTDRWDSRVRDRLREALLNAVHEEHTPHEVASSFALGAFITLLPTLGTGLILFVFLAALTDRISNVALFASLIVFNPLVKWGVYALSFVIGVAILGPVPGGAASVSLSGGSDVVARLLLGNALIALVLTPISYLVTYRIAVRMADSRLAERLEDAVEEIVQEPPTT